MDVRHFGCHISKMDVKHLKNGCQTFQKWMSDILDFTCRKWMSDFSKNGCPSQTKMDVRQKWMSDIQKWMSDTEMNVRLKNECQTQK